MVFSFHSTEAERNGGVTFPSKARTALSVSDMSFGDFNFVENEN